MSSLTTMEHPLEAGAPERSETLGAGPRTSLRSARVGEPDGADLGRWLPEQAGFSLQLGFVPATRADEGGPVHVLVLGDQPAEQVVTGVRLIGVLEADHTERGRTFRNDRLVAVAQDSRRFADVRELDELDEDLLRMLTQAWVGYNIARCAAFQVVAARGADRALRLMEQGSPHSPPWPSRSFSPVRGEDIEGSRL